MIQDNLFQPAAYQLSSFNCPQCLAFSEQKWSNGVTFISSRGYQENIPDLDICYCTHCTKYSIWHCGSMVHPESSNVLPPNSDLPDEILLDYKEAASIFQRSPRGAAALLRLSIQKLCIELGEEGKDINADIKSLVQKGLPMSIQQALDIVRVTGNEAVHPGELNLNDNKGIAESLFKLVNFICEKMISEPKEISSLYMQLPEEKLKGIEARDSN